MIVVLASIAVFAAVISLGRLGPSRDMSLLFGGLESKTAGEVVASLEAQGVIYEIRGEAIYVETSKRDSLRMTLAGEGLPANGGSGYELLDNLSGFGTTSQMFNAAYWRAKEGELARTILASPHVRSARVHISTPSSRSFQRDQKTTAAVTVATAGGNLSVSQARALRYLVASSVPGLAPDDVAVIDGEGGLIGASEEAGAGNSSSDRAQQIRDRVQRLLEARVGYGNAVVEVAVDTVTETESIVERRFDPDGRVAISTEVEERTNTAQDVGGGGVTVASNLPDGDGAGGDGNSSSQNSETRQRTNYEVSETQREIIKAPGAIRRLSVAVLINESVTTDEDGNEITEPRSEDEMTALRELVSSAVGFDEARGDVITLQSMSFEPIEPVGSEAGPIVSTSAPLDVMSLIKLGVISIVALILGLFVVRPILTSGATVLPEPLALPNDDSEAELGEASEPLEDVPLALPGAPMLGMADFGDPDMMMGGGDFMEENPVDRLREMIEERQDETMQILQNWMDDPADEVEKV
ncbi:flagellar basal-body MS-ring/collar protein FliF [Aestuariibius sp. HNIBRBA575]|uniref:flagellar basal-body MS-ring/collar protein FliF n=1 Tax=Aestuariibius sp. HNIBRBA575 TaxID=3233343 RepID=UPI0034A3690A